MIEVDNNDILDDSPYVDEGQEFNVSIPSEKNGTDERAEPASKPDLGKLISTLHRMIRWE